MRWLENIFVIALIILIALAAAWAFETQPTDNKNCPFTANQQCWDAWHNEPPVMRERD